MAFCHLYLTCQDQRQASAIADVLLAKRLIACAKFQPVASAYWWKGKMQSDDEVLMLMESAEELFDQVEAEVAKLHSYDTFVLSAIPLSRVSQEARKWWRESLGQQND